ncbi:patatin-like phospholipase family protein [Thiohalospira sp.]|uniref:patatin-like phospholipase family protein n=1 Tax=Thiohalospira sp. TaxID=3080549 RepID=UPI0039808F04
MRILFSLLLVLALGLPPAPAEAAGQRPPISVGLALGSGGAAGLAHIAMLEVFDDLEHKPDRITGTSIGAVIGVLYAAGLSAEEIRAIFAEFGGSELDALSRLMRPGGDLTLADFLQLGGEDGGVIQSRGFLEFLKEKVEARTFSDLAIPLEVVATDYRTGETVILDEGDLFQAVGASMAVPGLFPPVRRDGRLLIDGGASNPLPFDRLRGRHDVVVAVDVSGSREASPGDGTPGWSEILFKTFEVMQQALIAERLRSGEPDILIRPNVAGVRLLHFHRVETILEQAEPAAAELRQALVEAGVGPPGP